MRRHIIKWKSEWLRNKKQQRIFFAKLVEQYNLSKAYLKDRSYFPSSYYDLLNKTYFDAEHYIDYICARYEKYIKNFL